MREDALLDRREQRRGENVLDLAIVPVHARPQCVDDGVDRLHQRVLLVVDVPEQGVATSRLQHAVHLSERSRPVEPVERLGHRHGVDGAVGQRNRLRPARMQLDARQHPLKHAAHLVARLDGHDVGAKRDELSRELPRSGAEIEHATERQLLGDPGDRVGRVRRP